MKYKVGDRVKVTTNQISYLPEGLEGRIAIIGESKTCCYGVVFDKYNSLFHNLEGVCQSGYGLWLYEHQIEKYDLGAKIADDHIKSAIEYYTNYKSDATAEKHSSDGKKNMSNIVSFFNDLTVSSEDKELKKAGLKDSDLNWTRDAKDIVCNLDAKERGHKDAHDMGIKIGTIGDISPIEVDNLIKKFYAKLLDTAKKYNRREDKKSK